MAVTYKNIETFIQRAQVLGTEKIPVSSTEFITPSQIAAMVDISNFITKTVNDLVNYYTKSETYTRAEIEAKIAEIPGMEFVPVQTLPAASADTMSKIYVVPASNPQSQNLMDEYYTKDNGSGASTRYTWELFGSAAIDLSGYVTIQALNTALADYVTSTALATALADKQDTISDLADIRSGATLGSTALQPTDIVSLTTEEIDAIWDSAV